MAVDQLDGIDLIGVRRESGEVVLTISDHLDWSDSREHQLILQKKLNAYLAFVESGEILESYPDSRGRRVVFSVVFHFAPDDGSLAFLEAAGKIVESAGFSFEERVFRACEGNMP